MRATRRAMRAAHIDREVEPFIGFVPSLLLGAGGTIAAVTLARQLPLLPEHSGSLLVPGALASILTGYLGRPVRVTGATETAGTALAESLWAASPCSIFRSAECRPARIW